MASSKSLGSAKSISRGGLGIPGNVFGGQAVLAALFVLAMLTIAAQLSEVNSYKCGVTPSLTPNSTQANNSSPTASARTDADDVCFSWDKGTEADEWWAAHPTYEASSVDDDSVCFSPIRHGAKRDFFARLYANQYNVSNCGNVHSRHMWSSGWGADFSNVNKGLIYGLEMGQPFQVTFLSAGEGWHYAAFKEHYRNGRPPVCPTQDMYCYFLPMTPCSPAEKFDKGAPGPVSERDEKYWKFHYYPWAQEYATRQQMWIRRRVFEFIRSNGPKVITPCAVMHVRRSDVVLHGVSSRKYHSIEEYLQKLSRHGSKHKNILLLTDDANALEEAHFFHSEYNWMYFNKTRYKGSSGGWENQVPTDDPAEEVAAIIAEHEVAKLCDTLVYSDSGYGRSILHSMRQSGQQIIDFLVDEGQNLRAIAHNTSENELNARLEEARKKLEHSHNSIVRDDAENMATNENLEPLNESFNNGTSCAPRTGVVVLNLLGRLGNNLFELGFASKMAKELCWGVMYRVAWQSTFLNDEMKCFPNALLPPPSLDEAESQRLGIKETSITEITQTLYDDWVKEREADGAIGSLLHAEFFATAENVEDVLSAIRSTDSNIQVLNLKAFFLHGGWLDNEAIGIMRHELKPSESCCKRIPSDDTVVIHIQEFDLEPDQPWVSVNGGYYRQLFEHYSLSERPLWVVTQPKSLDSNLMKDIREQFPHAVVTAGEDAIDAFCILTKAKTLVLSHKSTYSQAAALIADPDVVVHYPIFDMTPFLTFGVDSWNYHLVSKDRNGIEEFEVSLERLTMLYDIGGQAQISQVGRGSEIDGSIVPH